MQNGNQKKEVNKSDITKKVYVKDNDGGIEDLWKIRHEFKTKYQCENDAPCFFLQAADMYVLSNLPNFIGLNIAIGYDNEKKDEVLIVVPVIRGRIQKEPEQIDTAEGETSGSAENVPGQTNTGESEMRGGDESVTEQKNTANDDTIEGAENVTNQTTTQNGRTRTTSTVAILAPGPCPPHPLGCNNCRCTGR